MYIDVYHLNTFRDLLMYRIYLMNNCSVSFKKGRYDIINVNMIYLKNKFMVPKKRNQDIAICIPEIFSYILIPIINKIKK